MSVSAEQELSSLFDQFDLNSDGEITPEEVEQVLMVFQGILVPEAAAALRTLVHTKGVVSRAAFLHWAQQQPGLQSDQILQYLFLLIDSDDSGWFSRDELAVLLSLLPPANDASSPSVDGLLQRLDRDSNGQISRAEFLALVRNENGLQLSLADLKRLKKTLVQLTSTARLDAVGLVEVDCDLGAGTAGAGAGIALLKGAVQRHQDLRRLSRGLIAEIEAQRPTSTRATARRSDVGAGSATPHARHIEAISQVMADAAGLVAATLNQGLFPIVLAGDHSTAASTIAGIRRAHPSERLGVIWIDAHADIHSPFTTPSGNMHGMPLGIATAHDNLAAAIHDPDELTRQRWRQLQELGGCQGPALKLSDLIYIAVRDTEPAEDATLAAHAIPVIGTEEVRREGPEAAARRCLDYLTEVDRIYVSFDVDALDSTICKGTGTPVPGGLWADEAEAILRYLLADPRVCCWEICEINPHLDTINTLAEVSLGIFNGGLEALAERLKAPAVGLAG